MDKERFIERILETENLTGDLEDQDANFLLDWGIQNLDQVLAGAEDEEVAAERVNALMAVMRKINRISGNVAGRDLPELLDELVELSNLSSKLKDQGLKTPTWQMDQMAQTLSGMAVRQALETLTQALSS